MRINGDSLQPSSGTKIEVPDGFGFEVGGTERLRIGSNGIYAPGSVIQVQSTTKSDTFSYSAGGGVFGDITGLSVSITPRFTSSKILILASVSRGVSADSLSYFRILRDATPILIGDTAGSRPRTTSTMYFGSSSNTLHQGIVDMKGLDTPASTSAITYKIQIATDGSGTHYINRSGADTDSNSNPRNISTITVMEIGG